MPGPDRSGFASERNKIAAVLARAGSTLTFGELDDRSAALARILRSSLSEGDRVAILLENRLDYFVATWAARRSGLRYVPINWHLLPHETAYIVDNSDARVLISSEQLREVAEYTAANSPNLLSCYSVDGSFGPFQAIRDCPPAPPIEEMEGVPMFYSSGTTGAPKGILKALPNEPFGQPGLAEQLMINAFGIGRDSVYLSPGPLYHAAPLLWTTGTQCLGGTSVVVPDFDAEEVLATIERYRVTHAQFVPTHFVRMLKLPEAVRARYDLSSLKVAIHAAAPCPPEVKQRMLDWLGPIVEEYYGASEGGFANVNAREWRERPGTVGKSKMGPVHILDDDGNELPAGEIGTIFFEDCPAFEFHKEPEKTREHINPRGWMAPGDLGYVDDDGYLYLADRKGNMIISGGVNIYPQEAENVLTMHPAVADVAVIGVPNPDFGEEVKAVVVLAQGMSASPELAQQLQSYCREQLAAYKCPRSVDFVDEVPRMPSGKLRKHELVKRYRTSA
ncbi:MAG: acyl-CoA synthetase [Alphaproteobacteria bacterium]|nr:acyl-CoA synthetase [Alphaproteobacteria bacterium]